MNMVDFEYDGCFRSADDRTSHIATLAAGELESLRRDAERYRWLRDRKEMDWSICNWCEDDREWMPEVRSPEVVDRAIDAAMKA